MKKKVLITMDWFAPAFKAGGPISSIVNLINHLHVDLDFYVLTGARDYGCEEDFENVETDKWVNWQNKAQVYYLSTKNKSRTKIFEILREDSFDYYYVQGVFSIYFSIYPLIWWKQYSTGQVIVAPRGMLHKTALSVKPWKKNLFLKITKFMGWFNDVYFHATDANEKEQIRRNFIKRAKVHTATMLPRVYDYATIAPLPKKTQQLNIICVSRISKEKNILFLLEVLEQISFPIRVSFLGPFEDKKYFEKFIYRLSQLPDNIFTKFFGNVQPDDVYEIMQKNNILISPSLGENYGHSIAEALYLGLPCIVGKNTPWKNLAQYNAGFNAELEITEFLQYIETYYNMDGDEFKIHQQGAIDYINNKNDINRIKNQYLKLFSL